MKINFALFLVFFAFAFAACRPEASRLANLTPTEVYKIHDAATHKKDAEAVRQTLTKGSLEMLDKTLKANGLTFEEFVKRLPDDASYKLLDTRNEKIEGDAASIEIKIAKPQAGKEWSPIRFKKEDGVWKVDVEKMALPE